MKLAKEISDASKEGKELGLTADELAFYDALTKPEAVKDFYSDEELVALTKELTDKDYIEFARYAAVSEEIKKLEDKAKERQAA